MFYLYYNDKLIMLKSSFNYQQQCFICKSEASPKNNFERDSAYNSQFPIRLHVIFCMFLISQSWAICVLVLMALLAGMLLEYYPFPHQHPA